MSWKSRNDLSPFGNRLSRLIGKKKLRTVAAEFYDTGLIDVASRKDNELAYKKTKRDSAIDSIEKRIREHINADGPECLQGAYIKAYCTYFSCSPDYLFGYTDIQSGDIEIRRICERTGLSEQAVINLCDLTENQSGSSNVHHCWSKLLEGGSFIGIPIDFKKAFDEASEIIQCQAAIEAITTVLKDKDPNGSIDYHLLDIKRKPIQIVEKQHSTAYYGLRYQLAEDISAVFDKYVDDQLTERRVYEDALEDLILQYRNEYYAGRGERDKIEQPKDGKFHFNKHFIV